MGDGRCRCWEGMRGWKIMGGWGRGGGGDKKEQEGKE